MHFFKALLKQQIAGGSEFATRLKRRYGFVAWLAGSFLLTPVGVVAQGQTRHVVTLEDSETLRQVGSLQLSPDGRALVYTSDGDIWFVATESANPPTRLTKGAIPRWSPNGKRLAYYSSESGSFQLWLRDMESGQTEQLTYLESGISPEYMTFFAAGSTNGPLFYSWSPDGTKLVFTSRVMAAHQDSEGSLNSNSVSPLGRSPGEPLVLTNTTPPQWTMSGLLKVRGLGAPEYVNGEIHPSSVSSTPPPRKVSQLFVVDSKSKKLIQLTKDDDVYFNPAWSPDGRTVVCTSLEGRQIVGGGVDSTNIYVIDVASGSKRALTKGLGVRGLPSWSPDGKWIAYGSRENFKMRSLFIVPSTGGEAQDLIRKLERPLGQFQWNSDSNSIVFTYSDGVTDQIATVDVQTRELEQAIRDEPASRWSLTSSRSGTIAWQQSDGTGTGLIYVLSQGSRSARLLVNLNPQVQQWLLGTQEIVRWKNSHAEECEGILIKPVGYQQGQKYPLIVDAYPFQASDFKGWPLDGNQMWASKGYAVFWPNVGAPHISGDLYNKPKSCDQGTKGPKGWDVTVDDIMSGVDMLIRRGVIDADRMGLYGFSNGGGTVQNLITRTNRFKCAVSAAGVYPDWLLPFFLRKDTLVSQLAGVTPWQDPEAYIRLSAVYHLDKVKTPVLLADGDMDGDILLGVIEMYNGLRILGRDVTLLRYPNQGHGFEGAAMKDFWERENAFFDRYLKPEKPRN